MRTWLNFYIFHGIDGTETHIEESESHPSKYINNRFYPTPNLTIEKDEAQKILDALWEFGMRPLVVGHTVIVDRKEAE